MWGADIETREQRVARIATILLSELPSCDVSRDSLIDQLGFLAALLEDHDGLPRLHFARILEQETRHSDDRRANLAALALVALFDAEPAPAP